MIHGIALRHFQAHEDTRLDFHPGVNSIIGTSNSGKSSILRAIYWVRYNRPTGIDFVSHWNRTKAGNPVEPSEVDINYEETTVTRKRAKDFNGYEVHSSDVPGGADMSLEAVGMDAPDVIQDMMNLSETNIQRQMDTPFLLSASNADVARFFNKVIRLDIIDRVLGGAESRRRKQKQEAVDLSGQVARLETALVELEWIPEAEKLLSKADRVLERIDGLDIQRVKLSTDMMTWDDAQRTIRDQSRVLKARKILAEVQEGAKAFTLLAERINVLDQLVMGYQNRLPDLELEMGYARQLIGSIERESQKRTAAIDSMIDLRPTIRSYKESFSIIVQVIDLKKARKLLQETETMGNLCQLMIGKRNKLEAWVTDCQDASRRVRQAEKDIKINTALLPEICPACGRASHGEHDEK